MSPDLTSVAPPAAAMQLGRRAQHVERPRVSCASAHGRGKPLDRLEVVAEHLRTGIDDGGNQLRSPVEVRHQELDLNPLYFLA